MSEFEDVFIQNVSLRIGKGKTLGIVGESGCGKTTLSRAMLRLIEPTAGKVIYDGIDLGAIDHHQLPKMRRRIQIIFQDPPGSMDPRLTVEQIVAEPMIVHGIGTTRNERQERTIALLQEVGMDANYLQRIPRELSGGQRQRVCIARALAVEPEFVICDEIVSALDVSIQAQVLNLLKDLQERHDLTYIFISHDLAVVKFMADMIAVMKTGRIIETGPAAALCSNSQNEYKRQLIAAMLKEDLD